MTTFGAAPGQNFAAVGGGHACAEAVSACAAEVARLEGSFHGADPARETIKEKLTKAGVTMLGASVPRAGKRTRHSIESLTYKQFKEWPGFRWRLLLPSIGSRHAAIYFESD
jgi:hypothetical protein